MKSIVLAGVLLLPQTPASAPSAAGGDRAIVQKAFGFRVAKPDASWAVDADTHRADSELMLTLRAPDGLKSFIVWVAKPVSPIAPKTLRDAAADKVRKEPSYKSMHIDCSDATIDDLPASRLRASFKVSDQHVTLVADYISANDRIYVLQSTVPHGDADLEMKAVRASFATFPIERTEAETASARLRELAAKCGSEIEWCTTWADASLRAKREKKIVLALFESYRGISVPEHALSGPFVDPEFVKLVRDRFIAFRMKHDSEAPFRDDDAYGMGPHSWGLGILFITPEGRIVRETGILEPSYLDALAREVAGEDKRIVEKGSSDLLARVAVMQRRARHGTEALASLAKARRTTDATQHDEIDADVALVTMRMGKLEEAEVLYTKFLEIYPESRRVPEAQFWLGAIEMVRSGFLAGRDPWTRLVETHSESPWAWKAAANLNGDGCFVNGGERLTWPSDDVVLMVTAPPREALAASESRRAADEALRFLLRTQQPDGSWICPEQMNLSTAVYTDAITAIAGGALLARASDPAARKGAERALEFALQAFEAGRLDGGKSLLGVYSVWSQTTTLALLAQCARAGVGDRARIDPAMKALIAALAARQQKSGGWPYVFIDGDPEGKSFDPSASFLTAGVLLALLDARSAGATVPMEAIDGARRFLTGLRNKEGSFRYMPAVMDVDVGGSFPEAAGRSPLCALALHRAGPADADGIRRALELFQRHRGTHRKEFGKELCHTGPQGQGAHYLFYDYRWAAAATRELPAGERAKARDAIIGDLLGVRLKDGSYQDLPMLGRAYGTAMAVLTFKELEAGR